MVCEKKNRPLTFSADRKILGSAVLVGNSQNLVFHWNGGPSGWDFPVPTEHQWCIMFPKPKGRWTYCFWCGSRRRQRRHRPPHSFLSALCLLTQWVDFDQTCIDTLLGRGKEAVRFWWPWLHCKGHTSTLTFSNFDQKRLSAPYLLNQMTDSGKTSQIVTLG